ncbi:MAG: hypothetical protein HY231_24870 [Acidobacteria bacterium]|nr:hypothetical protein [Acidobacteriota bacterium]
MSSQAVEDYNDIIARQPDLLAASREHLVRRFEEVRFVFGGRILSPYLRPHFVTLDEWQGIKRACETVWGAIEKVGRKAPQDALMLEQIGLTEGERELLAMSPGYENVSVSSRLDSFLTSERYSFVELNGECPAGIAYADVAAEIFLELPLMREFQKSHRVTPMYCRTHMLAALLKIYQEVRGTAEKPNIGIVDYKGLPTQREFELFKEFFESRGYATTIADPREVELREGKLVHGEFPIDLVYRRVLTTELLEKIDECQAFVQAYQSGAAVFVNSFRSKYVHKKMLFGVLTDERHQHYFSAAEREAIRLHIPWTRRVADVKTTSKGQAVELLTYIREHRHQLVLKPNDDYGGHGIVIGWEADARQWDAAIQQALAGDYLAQERVNTSKELFPWISEGGVQMVEQLLDIDPLLFFGEVQGAFTRLSSSSLANVTSGAGMVPTMLVE